MEELRRLSEEMDESLRRLRANGEAYAKAESEYQVAKNQTILRLRAEGYPATLITEMVKGDEAVAEKLLERDIKRVMYDTNKEHLMLRKVQFKSKDLEIEREWHSG